MTRKDAKPAPQIQIGKSPDDPMSVTHMLLLPARTPFGNLALKYTLIVLRLDRVNLSIRATFESYERAMADPMAEPLGKHQLLTEEIIYWLRKTADELIALEHVLSERRSTGLYPERVDPDSIGSLLGGEIPAVLVAHTGFLVTLNEISNAYKHSFINSDLSLVGRDEPVVNALGLKRNNLANPAAFYSVGLRDVVERFSQFFGAVREELRACGLPHLGGSRSALRKTPSAKPAS